MTDPEVERIMAMSDERVIVEGRIVAFLKYRATLADRGISRAANIEAARWYEGARDELDWVADMIERGLHMEPFP